MENKNFFKNLIEETKSKNSDASGSSKVCFTFPDYVVLKSDPRYISYIVNKDNIVLGPSTQQKALARLKSVGFNTPEIKYYTTSRNQEDYFEIQERAKGKPLFYCEYNYPKSEELKKLGKEKLYKYFDKINQARLVELLSAPDKHFVQYVENAIFGTKLGILNDCHSENLFYDNNLGFSFIDLPELSDINVEGLKAIQNRYCYKEEIDDLHKSLLKPFTYEWNNNIRYPYTKPYYNLICHKLYSALEKSNIAFKQGQLEEVKANLLNEKNNVPIISSDYEVKLILIKFDLLQPNEEDKKHIDENDWRPEPFNGPQDSLKRQMNFDFFKKCVEASTIDGLPALDYFKQVEKPKILNTKEIEKDFNDENEM